MTFKGIEGREKIDSIMNDYILNPPKTIFSKKIDTLKIELINTICSGINCIH